MIYLQEAKKEAELVAAKKLAKDMSTIMEAPRPNI